jgi:hypothetical protein
MVGMMYQEYKISKLYGGLSVMEMVGLVEEIERFAQE